MKRIIEAASFLPHMSIRSLESDIDNLIRDGVKDADYMQRREDRLHALSSSIKKVIEEIEANGQRDPSTVRDKASYLNAQCHALIFSKEGFTSSQVKFWFPFEEVRRVKTHLSSEIDKWLQTGS